MGASKGELHRALAANYQYLENQLEPASSLLAAMDQVFPLQYGQLLLIEEGSASPVEQEEPDPVVPEQEVQEQEKQEDRTEPRPEEPADSPKHQPATGGKAIHPASARAKSETDEHAYMEGG